MAKREMRCATRERDQTAAAQSNLTMKNTILAALFSVAFLNPGCSTLQKSDTAVIQGVWKGYDKTRPGDGMCSVRFSKNTVEFQGAGKDDWCKGIFTLHEDTNPKQIVATILEASDSRAVGQSVHAIYRIEAAMLTLAGNQPGNPTPPRGFDAPEAQVLVLKKP
jgi:uncharacterized protein (TIGR03067 family)